MIRSSGVVIFRLRRVPATMRGRPPSASMAPASSVTFGCASSAFRSAAKRKVCGVCASHSRLRSTVPPERYSLLAASEARLSMRLTVSVTGTHRSAPQGSYSR